MKTGDLIENRFLIEGICSTAGGMGDIMFVRDKSDANSRRLVLKFCKALDPRLVTRFKREIRLLSRFGDNSRVAQIIAFNVDHSPPYYVMSFYPDGDLTKSQAKIAADPVLQERTFCGMIDCINELHVTGVFHRDIKPQNFLSDGDQIVVSDMGLSMEVDSDSTTLTTTTEAWGTMGYLPPEYRTGGFKNPDAAGDIFMLGKTFYHLLTGRDPVYMTSSGISPGVYHVIQRCCETDNTRRYQSLAELKQALVGAYDIVLSRVDGTNNCRSKLESILSRIRNKREYETVEITDFLESVAKLEESGKDQICQALPAVFFDVLSQDPFDAHRNRFLNVYSAMVEKGAYSWEFAERIADCMARVFRASTVPAGEKAIALNLAIRAAHKQNRFAAMTTCTNMITSIQADEKELAEHVRPVLLACNAPFVATDIEIVRCKNDIIARTIRELKDNK